MAMAPATFDDGSAEARCQSGGANRGRRPLAPVLGVEAGLQRLRLRSIRSRPGHVWSEEPVYAATALPLYSASTNDGSGLAPDLDCLVLPGKGRGA